MVAEHARRMVSTTRPDDYAAFDVRCLVGRLDRKKAPVIHKSD